MKTPICYLSTLTRIARKSAENSFSCGRLIIPNCHPESSLAVGTRTGYRLYTINTSSEKLEEIYSSGNSNGSAVCWSIRKGFKIMRLWIDGEDICIVERLFSSSLVAIVSQTAPRKLRVCHFKKGTEICNYCYSNTILAVRLNRNVSKQVKWPRGCDRFHLFFYSIFSSVWSFVWRSASTFTISATWRSYTRYVTYRRIREACALCRQTTKSPIWRIRAVARWAKSKYSTQSTW